MKLEEIKALLERQIDSIIPPCSDRDTRLDHESFSFAYERYNLCAKHIKIFRGQYDLDPYHIMKWPIFLYILSNTIHKFNSDKKSESNCRIVDRLNSLNKSLHSCSISHKVELKEVFFFNYATNISLATTHYGNNLVLYHGVTVGSLPNGPKPILGDCVLIQPNCIISGSTTIGDNVVISANQKIINKKIPNDCIVFNDGETLKPIKRDYVSDYLML